MLSLEESLYISLPIDKKPQAPQFRVTAEESYIVTAILPDYTSKQRYYTKQDVSGLV